MTTADAPAGEPRPTSLPWALLVVHVGASEFALPIACVREVLRTPSIARVPFAPAHVRGAISLRGSVLPLVDLGMRLFGEPAAEPGATVVVTDERSGAPIALLVDAVPGLLEAESAQLAPLPEEAEASLPDGWTAGLVIRESGRPTTLLEIGAVLDLGQPSVARRPDSSIPHSQEQG